MTLTAGTAIRFKGESSDRMASEFADSLRGHCACHGSKVVITKQTRIRVKLYPNGVSDAPNLIDLSAHRSDYE
jgi:hypothetical protein